MVFSSLPFLFFYLPATLLIYFVSPVKLRNLFLLAVSLLFYGWGEPVYLFIMVFSILVDYINGCLIEKYRSRERLARFFLISSIVINLLLLGFFKYFDFFAENLARLGLPVAPLGVPLPIGISFYTFQTMSYTIDIYRREARAQKNIVPFGAFVTLFPQLIAGPIVRYQDIANELLSRRENLEDFSSGVERFVVGLSKKVLLANSAGALFDSLRLAPAGEASVLGYWIAIFSFAFQIYFDFSGYSDMAIGMGRMLGFHFKENFNYPYIAASITEFWRRWHISLSSWFREYLYIPLGGNKKGFLLQLRNLFIVWILTGFWHGASWNFILWGFYFAVLLSAEKLFLLQKLEKVPRLFSHLYALFFILLGWVLFSLPDLSAMQSFLCGMFGLRGLPLLSQHTLYRFLTNLPVLLFCAVGSTPLPARIFSSRREKGGGIFCALQAALLLAGLFFSTAYLVDAAYNPFLYFRF